MSRSVTSSYKCSYEARGPPKHIRISGEEMTLLASDGPSLHELPTLTRESDVVEDSNGKVDYNCEADEDTVMLWKRKIGTLTVSEVDLASRASIHITHSVVLEYG